ncbi:hypothetical protein [Nocardioides dongkuii]|uniref:hypothetical protein n=1 Tax=Nocardioides dongkuii TaxID=2760089 RepID=UPI001877509A|nr:hypothetical protein [Nocardioides dongkuii]
MSESGTSDADRRVTHDEAPPAPSSAWVPGAGLLFIGLWMVTDGGPLLLGWAFFALGLSLLIIGATACGVAWGMDLHSRSQR